MAPKKSTSSSASTRKSSNSSSAKSVHSSLTSKSKSPTKVAKTLPQNRLSHTKAQQLAESIEDTITSRRHSSGSAGRHAHFDKHVYPQNEGPEDLTNTEAATPEATVQKPTPKPRSKLVLTPKASRGVGIPPQISAKPEKPSHDFDFDRQRARNKPDLAEGQSYENLHGEEVVFDERESLCYLNHYTDVFDAVNDVQSTILSVAKVYFGYSLDDDEKRQWLQRLDKKMTEELRRYAGFVAVGGPCAAAGWEEIFLEPDLRSALAAGLIWKALKQHVFDELWFGATESQLKQLKKREEELRKEECGFERSRNRAQLLRSSTLGHWHHSNAKEDKIKLIAGIYSLVAPLLENPANSNDEEHILILLQHIIDVSVKLHHSMQLDGDTIYHWPTTLKDFAYERQMLRVTTTEHWNWLFDPQNRSACTEADPEAGLDKKKLDRVHRYAFLSRIVVFGPLEAWRKGGWRKNSGQIGQRRKLIIKGAVACRWGATRRFGDKLEPGQGEFVELRDCRDQLGKRDGWWLSAPRDPAMAATDVPVLGLKGKGRQPDLAGFEPSPYATV